MKIVNEICTTLSHVFVKFIIKIETFVTTWTNIDTFFNLRISQFRRHFWMIDEINNRFVINRCVLIVKFLFIIFRFIVVIIIDDIFVDLINISKIIETNFRIVDKYVKKFKFVKLILLIWNVVKNFRNSLSIVIKRTKWLTLWIKIWRVWCCVWIWRFDYLFQRCRSKQSRQLRLCVWIWIWLLWLINTILSLKCKKIRELNRHVLLKFKLKKLKKTLIFIKLKDLSFTICIVDVEHVSLWTFILLFSFVTTLFVDTHAN